MSNPDADYAIVIHKPDGESIIIEIDNSEIDNSEISGYTGQSVDYLGYAYTYLLQRLNIELNAIISEGYTLMHIESFNSYFNGGRYYLSVFWTTVGLTEIDSSELDLRISPNPAKEYINVEVDFTSQPSELVLISELGYIYFKKDISNILSGQGFTIDISNVPAGKYLVTVKDDKRYFSPLKIIDL